VEEPGLERLFRFGEPFECPFGRADLRGLFLGPIQPAGSTSHRNKLGELL
jgi:hypothetical protein